MSVLKGTSSRPVQSIKMVGAEITVEKLCWKRSWKQKSWEVLILQTPESEILPKLTWLVGQYTWMATTQPTNNNTIVTHDMANLKCLSLNYDNGEKVKYDTWQELHIRITQTYYKKSKEHFHAWFCVYCTITYIAYNFARRGQKHYYWSQLDEGVESNFYLFSFYSWKSKLYFTAIIVQQRDYLTKIGWNYEKLIGKALGQSILYSHNFNQQYVK